MRILAIGDVVSAVGREVLFRCVKPIKEAKNIDLCIANGENSNHGRGMTRSTYEEMTRAGVDGFTMGNHTFGSKEIIPILAACTDVVRPINYSPDAPGKGTMLLKGKNGQTAAIINAIGRTYMDRPYDSPFKAIDEEIELVRKKTPIILVDFHCEATSEKQAMGHFLDGRVSAVFGTHTHVQTADEQILPGGTGYITDLGMTGPEDSILGMRKEIIVERFLSVMPRRFEIAEGKGQFNACIFDIDDENGMCRDVERIFIAHIQ